MKIEGAVARWLILAGIGIAGFALISLPAIHKWTWDYGISKDLGIALVIFALLGATIERWFRADFARDVFEAAIGHILEPELRDEIHWVAGFKWLSVKTRIRVQVEELKDDIVKVTCDLERELKNISSHPEQIRGTISIDDWGIPGHKTEILMCGAIGPDGVKRDQTEIKTERAGSTTARTDQITAQPDQIVKTFSRSVEYKHRNDIFNLAFNWPTRNPELEVECSPALEYDAGFSHRAGVKIEPMIVNRKTLQGTFLPYQSVVVRWWPKG